MRSIPNIVEYTAKNLNTTVKILTWKKQNAERVRNRWICFYVCWMVGHSKLSIAKWFKKDHTTIMHGIWQIRQQMEQDKDLKKFINGILSEVSDEEDIKTVRIGSNEEIIEALRVQRLDIIEQVRKYKGYTLNETLINKMFK